MGWGRGHSGDIRQPDQRVIAPIWKRALTSARGVVRGSDANECKCRWLLCLIVNCNTLVFSGYALDVDVRRHRFRNSQMI